MHHHAASIAAAHQALAVVQPGIVASELTSTDQGQALRAVLRAAARLARQSFQVREQALWREVQVRALGDALRQRARASRTQVDAVGPFAQLRQTRAAPRRPRAYAVGAQPQAEIEDALRAQRVERRGGRPRGSRRARASQEASRQTAEDLPIVLCASVFVEAGRRVLGRVPGGQEVQREVVVAAREGRGGRQDQVGVARGLVQVEVDGEHEVEGRQRLVEPSSVRRGEHGVAGEGHESAYLAVSRREDLLRQTCDGELTTEGGQPAHATREAPEASAAHPHAPRRVARLHRRCAEQDASLTVEL